MGNAVKDPVGDPVEGYKKLSEESLQTIANYKKKQAESRLTISKKDERIDQLLFELNKFQRYLFGSKSEKLSSFKEEDLSQMSLFDLGTTNEQQEELSEQVASVTTPEKKSPKKRAKGTGRMKLPEELRREEVIIEPEENTTGCTYIGDEITEVLDIVPAELYVKRYVRRKYARPNGEGILTGSLPERVIEKGIPSNRLIGEMVLDKYVYGSPLHRQISKYRRLGVNIPASTASDWIMKGWKHLAPLWELLKLMVINQKYIQADESPIKVQDKQKKADKKKNIHQGYMWVYHAPVDRLVLFDYQKGRDCSGPKAMLEDYKGILQTDGYQVYESLYAGHPDIALIYCMAHARRKFVDAVNYDKEKANTVLALMQKLYKLEQDMREEQLTWQQRTEKRQKEAVPVLNEIKNWMEAQIHQVLPKSPLGQAINYALPRWSGLSAYTQHGQVEIDNNLVENAI
ncbi:MAG: IS66 family transposase [Verrucomicrobiota bacterium]